MLPDCSALCTGVRRARCGKVCLFLWRRPLPGRPRLPRHPAVDTLYLTRPVPPPAAQEARLRRALTLSLADSQRSWQRRASDARLAAALHHSLEAERLRQCASPKKRIRSGCAPQLWRRASASVSSVFRARWAHVAAIGAWCRK